MWFWILVLCDLFEKQLFQILDRQTLNLPIVGQKDIIFLPMHLSSWQWGSVVKQGHLMMPCSEVWIYVFGNFWVIQARNDLLLHYCPLPPIQCLSFLWLTVKIRLLVLVGPRSCIHSIFIESSCVLGDGNRMFRGISSLWKEPTASWERQTS